MGGAKAAAPLAKYIFERLYTPQDVVVEQKPGTPSDIDEGEM